LRILRHSAACVAFHLSRASTSIIPVGIGPIRVKGLPSVLTGQRLGRTDDWENEGCRASHARWRWPDKVRHCDKCSSRCVEIELIFMVAVTFVE
jgi:hypothetical protein